MVVNSDDQEAHLNITLLFEDCVPKEVLKQVVPARRAHCFRMDLSIWGDDYIIKLGQYAVIL